MARTLTVQGVSVAGGRLDISFSKGADPLIFSYSYPSKLAALALLQELDDSLEQALLLICVALYARQSGDTTLNIPDGLVGRVITLDLTRVNAAITFS